MAESCLRYARTKEETNPAEAKCHVDADALAVVSCILDDLEARNGPRVHIARRREFCPEADSLESGNAKAK